MGKKTKGKTKGTGKAGSHAVSQSNGGSPAGVGKGTKDTNSEALIKASQTGDVKVLKQLLDAGGGDSNSSANSAGGPLDK